MMQHNEPNKFQRLLKEKGYYIVLGLCMIAVAITGYVFISAAVRQNQAAEQQQLSVPVIIDDPEDLHHAPKDAEASVSELPPPEETEKISAPVQEEPPTDEPVLAPEQAVQPVSGTVTQNHAMEQLAYNRTTQDWRVHNGMDLSAEAGTPVVAAKSGTVTAVFDDEYYGITVVIRHEDGYTTHYCSLAENPAVSAGDTVKAGQVIGAVGTTALLEAADGPHLHFEVYCDGQPADPADFLS